VSGIVLFDGTCLFCEGTVKFIAAHDPAGYFKFGASQTPAAQAIMHEHGVDRVAARSIILIEDGQTYLRSTASLRIARRLTFPWNMAAAFLMVPRPIRDGVYNIVSAVRQKIAGESNACDIPPPAIRDRLI
jgi:predicted DCC family thiol-disulfide oxidoreductase YuxK